MISAKKEFCPLEAHSSDFISESIWIP